MEFNDLLRTLRRRWMVIVALMLLGGLVAQGVTMFTKPTYAATAQLFVATQGNDSVGDLNQGNAFAQSRVASYVTLATSNRILGEVGQEVGLTVDELRTMVSAANPPETVLIDVRGTSGNASQTSKIANAVADHLVQLVNSVENTDSSGGSSAPVALTQVQDANTPAAPFAPSALRNGFLGVVLGLLAGISTALLIGRFDTRLRGRDDITELTDASILGTFAPEAGDATDLVLRDLESYSGRTEGYRQLRTHLQFMNIDGGVRSVLLTSSVPGEGKSTTAANLAIVLAEGGVRVLLVDADLRRPRLDAILGLERAVGLTTVLTGRIGLDDAVQTVPIGAGLSVLTSGAIPPNPSELLASESMERLLAEMQQQYDVVVIDSPPLVGVSDPAGLATMVSGVLLVASADGRLHRDQFTQALEQLSFVRAKLFGLVLNRVDMGRRQGYYGYETKSEARKNSPRKPVAPKQDTEAPRMLVADAPNATHATQPSAAAAVAVPAEVVNTVGTLEARDRDAQLPRRSRIRAAQTESE